MGLRNGIRSVLTCATVVSMLVAPPGGAEAAGFRFWGAKKAASERILVPGGRAVGVEVASRGVLVIGTSDLGAVASPARAAGLKMGDVIESVDGELAENAERLQSLLNGGGVKKLKVRREGKTMDVAVTPARGEDGAYRLGAWVRDGAAGVGTLTYYDPSSGAYGALGHAICDADAGVEIDILGGELLGARLTGVRKSEPGAPGELLGVLEPDNRLGSVTENTPYGVFGAMDAPAKSELYPEGVPVLPMGEVRLGPAQMLSDVDGTVRAYACEIVSAEKQPEAQTRGLMLRVTDDRLLETTGGIVQGMSGSPILQEGKILGAVTHVCLSDPACGYGVYVEWMLEESDELKLAA